VRPLIHVRREAVERRSVLVAVRGAPRTNRISAGVVARGAVNKRGRRRRFLAALHAIRGAGRKCGNSSRRPRAKKRSARRTSASGAPSRHIARALQDDRRLHCRTGQGVDGQVHDKPWIKGIVELEPSRQRREVGGPGRRATSLEQSACERRQPGVSPGPGGLLRRHRRRHEPATDGFTRACEPLSETDKKSSPRAPKPSRADRLKKQTQRHK